MAQACSSLGFEARCDLAEGWRRTASGIVSFVIACLAAGLGARRRSAKNAMSSWQRRCEHASSGKLDLRFAHAKRRRGLREADGWYPTGEMSNCGRTWILPPTTETRRVPVRVGRCCSS